MKDPSLTKDLFRVFRAVVTNQLAAVATRPYLRLTAQTGRGSEEESPDQVANYFRQCFDKYLDIMGAGTGNANAFLTDKTVLEYGPGDIPGTALLFYAYGAKKVICVDRFPMIALSTKNISVLKELVDMLSGDPRERALSSLKTYGDHSTGFKDQSISYRVRKNGISGICGEADLVVSRAVLEHVNDLRASLQDIHDALRRDGMGIHLVDLKSHGLHQANPLDFLRWPAWLWRMMYSNKGYPNRWRVDRYRMILDSMKFSSVEIRPTAFAKLNEVNAMRPHLAPPFRHLSDDDLQCLGFWLIVRK